MPRRKLTPIAELHKLNPEAAERRRFARRLGMKDEFQLDRFVRKVSNLPPSDPRYLPPDIPDDRLESAIRRRYQRDRKILTPWRDIEKKYKVLVIELKKMSAFTFREQYKQQIEAAMQDSSTSDYGKRQLRKLRTTLNKRNLVPTEMAPEKSGQGRLF